MAAGAVGPAGGPALIDANDDKIVYELMFDLPNAGLQPPDAPTGAAVVALDLPKVPTFGGNPDQPEDKTPEHCYLVRSCRSAVGRQPYDNYTP